MYNLNELNSSFKGQWHILVNKFPETVLWLIYNENLKNVLDKMHGPDLKIFSKKVH